jgi:membrane protease YdiL (CAAX protease family)
MTDSAITRLWGRIPLIVRAILLGFAVSTLGVGAWVACWTVIPPPWWFLLMSGLLWTYWKYFSGSWRPASTVEYRRASFRETRLPVAVWRLGLGAAACFVVAFQSCLVVNFRIIELPAEALTSGNDLGALPVGLAWLGIVMASLVAGICEEVGFRGYMQVPLERRYGPATAIAVVVVVFLAAHLHQAWLPPFLIAGIIGSVMLGTLAWASRSLIPGMIGHMVMDIFNFSYWWSDVAGRFERRPIGETGLDAHFVAWTLLLAASLALFFWTVRRLIALRREGGSASP